MNLRPYNATDLEALVALDEQCFEPLFRFSHASMRSFAEARNACVVLAEVDAALVGFCILHVELSRRRTVGYLVTLDVAAAHSRNGIATSLLRAVEALAIADGCTSIQLHVHAGNTAARAFYQRLGFVTVDEVPDFYAPSIDAVAMRRVLADAGS